MPSTNPSQPEWTVTKCFRVLRPLTSRQQSNRLNTTGSIPSQHGGNRHRSKTNAQFGNSPDSKLDPDWIVKPAKSGPRQYARTTISSDSAIEAVPGMLSLSTPIIQRLRGTRTNPLAQWTPAVEERCVGRGGYRIVDSVLSSKAMLAD